ncbi:hypothetical protein KCU65_g9553, partial [Aureobasidium melanogenum]
MQLARLPTEIQQQILEHVAIPEATMATPMDIDASSDPMIPPADGSSPLLALPKELRRIIFGYILPPKDKIIEPYKTPTQRQAPAPVAPVAPVAPAAPTAHLASFIQANLHHVPQLLQNMQNVPAHILQAVQNVVNQMIQNNQPVPANVLQIIQNAATQIPPSVPTQPNTQQTGSAAAAAATLETAKEKRKPALAVGDALVLCKQIASEILVTLYEERTFAMNVYEGISDGGIEFLNSGRQRLQYHENFTQVRFKRFEGAGDPFGFSRVKRLIVRIYPATDTALEQKNSRHNAMHTHFMVRALVKLLKNDGSFGLNRLQMRFVEPRSHLWRPYPWQNTTDFSLRSSSIHGISNVEIILRGLIELRQVQAAVCELPPGLYRDGPLGDFVDRLLGVITNKLHPSTMDDEIAVKIEGARDMLDDWIHSSMFSTATSRAMPALLKDSDFNEVQGTDCFNSYPDEDNYYEMPARRDVKPKSFTSEYCSPLLRDVYEKRTMGMEMENTEDRDTNPYSSNNRTSPSSQNGHNDDRSARTCTTRRSRRNSPLSSSSRESSGGASLLEMVSIGDEDALPRLGSLVRGDLTSPKSRRTRPTAHRTNSHGSVAKPELRRSERAHARNSTDNARPTTNEDKTLSSRELVFSPPSAVDYPLPTPARVNGFDNSYSDPFDSTSHLLNSINRRAYEAQDQPPLNVLDQTAGNNTQDNRRSINSKQNTSQDIINLEDDEEGDIGLMCNSLA